MSDEFSRSKQQKISLNDDSRCSLDIRWSLSAKPHLDHVVMSNTLASHLNSDTRMAQMQIYFAFCFGTHQVVINSNTRYKRHSHRTQEALPDKAINR